MKEHERISNGTASDANPYRAPIGLQGEDPTESVQSWYGRPFGWMIVFGLNLPMVLLFAKSVVDETGWLGIAVAVGILLLAGVVGTKLTPSVMRMVTAGGLFTAVAQFIPIIQLLSGFMALEIYSSIGLTGNSDADDAVRWVLDHRGSFVATFLTAFPIITVALSIGAVIHMEKSRKKNSKQKQ